MIGGTILARRRHPPADVARRCVLGLLCSSGEARLPPTILYKRTIALGTSIDFWKDLRRSEPRGDSGGSGWWRKEAAKSWGRIHNITEKRRERSSVRAANESRFMRTTHSCTCTSVAKKWRHPPISSSAASLTSATGCPPTDWRSTQTLLFFSSGHCCAALKGRWCWN